jgi:MFS family permease
MSVAGTSRIMADYGLDPTRMGTGYSAFLLIYSICMIPGGLFIDRFGPRRALMVVGFGSALFAALTGVVGWLFAEGSSLWLALVIVRGTMGLVSAPLHPAGARAVGNWFSLRQRSLANGIVTGAAIAGVAVTYRGFGALSHSIGWQAGFVASAAVTAVLTALWAWHATDHP